MISSTVRTGTYGTKPAARSRNIAACGGASSNPELHIQADISAQRKVEMTESEKNAEIVRLRERCALLESLLGEGIRNHYFNEAVCFSVMAFGSEPRGGHVLRRIVPLF